MTDEQMNLLLAQANLAFELNTDPDPEAACADCGGEVDPYGDVHQVAATLALGTPDAGRICESCCDKRKPGFWEITTGLDDVFEGLMRLPQQERALMAAQIGMFVQKIAEFD